MPTQHIETREEVVEMLDRLERELSMRLDISERELAGDGAKWERVACEPEWCEGCPVCEAGLG